MLPTTMSSHLLRLSSNPSCAPLTQTWFKAAATAGLDGVPRPGAAGQQQTGGYEYQGGRPAGHRWKIQQHGCRTAGGKGHTGRVLGSARCMHQVNVGVTVS